MLCHRSIKAESASIRKLATMAGEDQDPAWVRVYQLPDFVFFSHAKHSEAEVACTKCHGPVEKPGDLVTRNSRPAWKRA